MPQFPLFAILWGTYENNIFHYISFFYYAWNKTAQFYCCFSFNEPQSLKMLQ